MATLLPLANTSTSSPEPPPRPMSGKSDFNRFLEESTSEVRRTTAPADNDQQRNGTTNSSSMTGERAEKAAAPADPQQQPTATNKQKEQQDSKAASNNPDNRQPQNNNSIPAAKSTGKSPLHNSKNGSKAGLALPSTTSASTNTARGDNIQLQVETTTAATRPDSTTTSINPAPDNRPTKTAATTNSNNKKMVTADALEQTAGTNAQPESNDSNLQAADQLAVGKTPAVALAAQTVVKQSNAAVVLTAAQSDQQTEEQTTQPNDAATVDSEHLDFAVERLLTNNTNNQRSNNRATTDHDKNNPTNAPPVNSQQQPPSKHHGMRENAPLALEPAKSAQPSSSKPASKASTQANLPIADSQDASKAVHQEATDITLLQVSDKIAATTRPHNAGDGLAKSLAHFNQLVEQSIDQLMQNVPARLVRQLDLQLTGIGKAEIKLALQPESLGHVNLHLRLQDRNAYTLIEVESQQTATLFENALSSFNRSFSDNGYAQQQFEIHIERPASDQSIEIKPAGRSKNGPSLLFERQQVNFIA